MGSEPEPEPGAERISPHHIGLTLDQAQVDRLLRMHLPAAGGCVSLERIRLGFNNISYIVTAGNSMQYVVRATRDSWPAEKVECELAAIRLVSELTSLPVPTPLCYDASAAEFGCRWILMERMEGRVMEATEFDALSPAAQQTIVGQLVDFLAQLQAIRWCSSGSFYPASTIDAADGSDAAAAPPSGRDAVALGPYFDGRHGPFVTCLEYGVGMLRASIAAVERKPALASMQKFAARATALAASLADGTLQIPDVPFVTFHGDFAFRNMLVVGEGDELRVSAFLDWEWCGSKPAYCEWMDCSFGDTNIACNKLVQEECERRGLLCPAVTPGMTEWAELAELGEELSPWCVGLGPRTEEAEERDVATLASSAEICDRLLTLWEGRMEHAAIAPGNI